MKPGQRITVQIKSSEGDNEHIRLIEFIDQLRAVMSSLRKAESLYYKTDTPSLFYRIVELSYASPARVILEAHAEASAPQIKQSPEYASHVVRAYTAALYSIERKGRPMGQPSVEALRVYQGISSTLGRHPTTQVSISVGRRTVQIDDNFRKKIDDAVGPDEFSEGSISGTLEAINLHRGLRFTVYPTIGPPKVTAVFHDKELREKVKTGIDHYVTVYGRLQYKNWDPFPHSIEAEDIDIHPPDSELPSMLDIQGMIPGLTGDLNAAEFMEKVRRERW